MCLALPGRLIEMIDQEPLLMGRVDCNGVIQKVCMAFTPHAQVGCYVIVHVGFAISILNEEEAKKTLSLFEEIQ